MGLLGTTKLLSVTEAEKIREPPPPGQAHSVALENTKQPGRSAVYRHWRCRDGLLQTLDQRWDTKTVDKQALTIQIRTAHEFFEKAANTFPKNHCLGHRPWDPVKKAFKSYTWENYASVQQRRNNFGKGIVEIHKDLGVTGIQYGVGLWCQNRPEWQIAGESTQDDI
ncbi:hypothetical protein MRB53_039008 [Persea americana]|nr:hypothetical protein MRB53_039008 [Persea americana]